MFAAIWLVYLAQPARCSGQIPNLAHRYLGLAELIAFAAVFVATFAAARFLRISANRGCPGLCAAAVVAEAIFVPLGFLSSGRPPAAC